KCDHHRASQEPLHRVFTGLLRSSRRSTAAARLQRRRLLDRPPQTRPDTRRQREKRLPLLRVPREVAPRGPSALLRVATATARHEVAFGLITADAERLDVVQRQLYGRKRTAAVDALLPVASEDTSAHARSRLCHGFQYTGGHRMLRRNTVQNRRLRSF